MSSNEGENSKRPKLQSRATSVSCSKCHRRKQRCNRETPCQHCIARDVPFLCSKLDVSRKPLTIEERMSRLEKVVEDGFASLLDSTEAATLTETDSTSQPTSTSATKTLLRKTKSFEIKTGVEGDSFEPLSIMLPYNSARSNWSSLRESLQNRLGRTSLPEIDATNLFNQLPDTSVIQSLLDFYFQEVNRMMLPLPEKVVQAKFDKVLLRRPLMDPADIDSFALLSSTLALAILTCPENLLVRGCGPRMIHARSLHQTAISSLTEYVHLSRRPSLERMNAWRISSHFLSMDSNMATAWEYAGRAVMTAFAMELHRESRLASFKEVDRITSRQVWSTIYYWERSISLSLDRPSIIQDDLCTTRCLHTDATKPGVESHLTYLHQLASFTGRANRIIHSAEVEEDYSKAHNLEEAIVKWRSSLPSYFRQDLDSSGTALGDCNRALDSSLPFVRHQRYIIESEIDTLRMCLARPFLFGEAGKKGRAVSLHCALHSILMREDLFRRLQLEFGSKADIPRHHSTHTFMAKRLDNILTSCVLILFHRGSPETSTLRRHVEAYIDSQKRKADDFRIEGDHLTHRDLQRETNSLQLFLERADARKDTTDTSSKQKEQQISTREKGREIQSDNRNLQENFRWTAEDLLDMPGVDLDYNIQHGIGGSRFDSSNSGTK